MHIQTINYQRTFNTGNYSSERIGVEIAINAGESAEKALDTAKKLVEEYHEKSIKEFIEQTEEIISPEKELENTMSFIDACKTEGQLREVYLMCQKNPALKSYYEVKLKTLKTK